MPILMSAQARPELRPYVRAYAQRIWETGDLPLMESVPAQLEQILNFELGVMPSIQHRNHEVLAVASVGGAQTSYSGQLHLRPGVESFAIFFRPAGWSLIFKVPIVEITNHFLDATAVMGAPARALWNHLGEAPSFETRVAVAEQFLLDRLSRIKAQIEMAAAAHYIFRHRGAVRISSLAALQSISLRHFQRRFECEVGASPKAFARVARFQAALDAKLTFPQRSWLNIAHSFGYYDQMHMIHDFEGLGRMTPTQLVAEIGDVRPPALTSEKH